MVFIFEKISKMSCKGFGIKEKKETIRRMMVYWDFLHQFFKLVMEFSNGFILLFHEIIQPPNPLALPCVYECTFF
jgi:hypothetical protein